MAIYGVDGVPGSGKSYFAVLRCRRAMRQGVPIFSNMPLYDMRLNVKGEPLDPMTYGWPWGTYLQDVPDLLACRRGLALLDEADQWFNALEYRNIPAEARSYWTQSRNRGMNLMWTCTHYDRMYNVIRDITAWLWRCHCFENVPYLQNWTFSRMFDPKSSTVRKAKMWNGTMYNPQIYKLYPTGFIQGNGKDVETIGLLAEEEEETFIAPTIGTHEQWLHIASSSKLRLFEGTTVAPLLRPDESRKLTIALNKMSKAGPKGLTPGERVALARLKKVGRFISGTPKRAKRF